MNFKHESNKIYLENDNGDAVAEITFQKISENKVNINHTYVDKSLRGQGIAEKLILALTSVLREKNMKATATCWYAAEWFENHPEYNDIYLG